MALLAPVLQDSFLGCRRSTFSSCDSESSSSNYKSETDEPLSSSTSTNSFSHTDSRESSSSEDEPEFGRSYSCHELEKDVKRCIYVGAKVTYSESLLLLLRYSLVHALSEKSVGGLIEVYSAIPTFC